MSRVAFVLAVLLAAAALGSGGPATAGTTPAWQLTAGHGLASGETLPGVNPDDRLVMQTDGNLVLYSNAFAMWQSHTVGNPGAYAVMQSDGNFVVYSVQNRPLWSTNTSGAKGSYAALSGDFEIELPNGTVIWSTGGEAPTATLTAGGSLRSDHDEHLTSRIGRFTVAPFSSGILAVDETVGSFSAPVWSVGDADGERTVLSMQSDGNAVLLRAGDGRPLWSTHTSGAGNRLVIQDDGNLVVFRPDGRAVWASGSTSALLGAGEVASSGRQFRSSGLGQATVLTAMQTDGNLVRYTGGRAVWQSHTAGNPGATLAMQTDGNLVVYARSGRALWATGTAHCGNAVVFDTGDGTIRRAAEQIVWDTASGSHRVC